MSRGTRLQTHAPTPHPHTHTCTHTELCPGRLLIPLGIHELDMLWAPDTRVPPRVCYPLGCFVFQSTAQETLLGHWCYLSVHDRGQSIAKQLLLDTTLPSHPPPQPSARRLGDWGQGDIMVASQSCKHQSLSQMGRWGLQEENRVRSRVSKATCPSSQIRAGACITGCQNSVVWRLWAQALEPNRLSPADLAKTVHGSELHFLQNMDQGHPDIKS